MVAPARFDVLAPYKPLHHIGVIFDLAAQMHYLGGYARNRPGTKEPR